MRADLLEVFKIINGLDSIFPADFFIMENEDGNSRGHPYKIHKLHSRLDIRKYFSYIWHFSRVSELQVSHQLCPWLLTSPSGSLFVKS